VDQAIISSVLLEDKKTYDALATRYLELTQSLKERLA